VPDVVGAVMIHAVEVVAALDERDLVVGELGQSVAQLLEHRVRILAKVHRVREPRGGKLDLAVRGFDVLWIVLVPGDSPVTYTSSAGFRYAARVLFTQMLTAVAASRRQSMHEGVSFGDTT
jgi:hypothetical protein